MAANPGFHENIRLSRGSTWETPPYLTVIVPYMPAA